MKIELKNITKKVQLSDTRQIKIIDNLSFTIEDNDFAIILGESGSGKSTILNILTNLDQKYEGKVFYNNQDVKQLSLEKLLRNNIGFVFQNFNLFDDQTVLANIELSLKYIKSDNVNINDILKKLKIEHLKNKKIQNLSGGEKQRVAIARALIKNPDIIVADEPTGALDNENRDIILDILKSLQAEGKTIILVSHDESLSSYANKIIRIADGKILEIQNTTKQVNNQIKHKEYETRSNLKIGDIFKLAGASIKNNFKKVIVSLLGVIISMIILLSVFGLKFYIDSASDQILDITTNKNNLKVKVENKNIDISQIEKKYNIISSEKRYDLIDQNTGYRIKKISETTFLDNTFYISLYMNAQQTIDQITMQGLKILDKQYIVNEVTDMNIIKIIDDKIFSDHLEEESGTTVIAINENTFNKIVSENTQIIPHTQYVLNKNDAAKFQSEIQNQYPEIAIIKSNDLNEDAFNRIYQNFIYPIIFAFFLTIIAFITLLVLVYTKMTEERYNFAVKKILGYSSKDLIKVEVIEIILKVVLGSIIALVIYNYSKYILPGQGLGVIKIYWDFTIKLILVVIIIMSTITYFTARRIDKINPSEALNYE